MWMIERLAKDLLNSVRNAIHYVRYLSTKMDPLNVQLHVSLVVETLPTGISLKSQNCQQNNKKWREKTTKTYKIFNALKGKS
jgi:hypothetical protein